MTSTAPPTSATPTKVAKETTGGKILPDTTFSSNNTPLNVKSKNSNVYSSPTPSKKTSCSSKIGSSQRKKPLYKFRGNVRSPAPKVDSILINHLVSPEQSQAVVKGEMNGADVTSDIDMSETKKKGGLNFKALEKKFNFKNPKERKKIYDRLRYLNQILLNHPEEFIDLCKAHDIPVEIVCTDGKNEKVVEGYYFSDLAPEAVASALFSTTDVGLNTEEDTENAAPVQKPKVLFKEEDNNDAEAAADGSGLKGDIVSDEDKVNDKTAKETTATPAEADENAVAKNVTASSIYEDSISIDELNAMFHDLFSNMIRRHTSDIRRDVDELKQKDESI